MAQRNQTTRDSNPSSPRKRLTVSASFDSNKSVKVLLDEDSESLGALFDACFEVIDALGKILVGRVRMGR